MGRIITKTEIVNSITVSNSYEYDSFGRLSSAETDGVVQNFSYDKNGNRTDSSQLYDAQDRLVEDIGYNYQYSEIGMLIGKTRKSDGYVESYSYDTWGNLLGVSSSDNLVSMTYEIDGMHRRVKSNNIITPSGDYKIVYKDQLNPIAKVNSTTNQIEQRYVYGNTLHVPDYFTDSTSNKKLLIKDSRGSVVLVVDANTGIIEQEIDYDAWGRVLSDSNPGFQLFGFAGGIYDSATGLVRFGDRDYDGEVRRWISKDPIYFEGDQNNLYVYVNNDPINFFDPEGNRGARVHRYPRQRPKGKGVGQAKKYLNTGNDTKDAVGNIMKDKQITCGTPPALNTGSITDSCFVPPPVVDSCKLSIGKTRK